MRWVRILWIGLVASSVGCATGVVHKPQPEPQVHQGLLDRMKNDLRELSLSPKTQDELSRFQWPLRSMRVTSHFGHRGHRYHEGIDLRASPGTPVYAVQSGRVLYASSKIRGYGKLIILKHGANVSTVYAHNSKILVRSGQRVKQGQMIARTGNTGHSNGPHLHFEVRTGLGAIDPIQYIPHSPESVAFVVGMR